MVIAAPCWLFSVVLNITDIVVGLPVRFVSIYFLDDGALASPLGTPTAAMECSSRTVGSGGGTTTSGRSPCSASWRSSSRIVSSSPRRTCAASTRSCCSSSSADRPRAASQS